jgi:xylulokinase
LIGEMKMSAPLIKIIAYDVGTTGLKTCLFSVGRELTLLASEMEGYDLYILDDGGAEQEPLQWWEAMCATTQKLLSKTATAPEEIAGISFCSQMQGLVLVDRDGQPLRRMMSYMDQRACDELQETIGRGFKIAGINLFKLLISIRETGVVAASVKDPVWKYRWVEKNEPAVFERIYKWLDVKEFLICKCTGQFVMTEDSAFATLLYSSRKGKAGWSKAVCKLLGVDLNHLSPVINSTDRAGIITPEAASMLGLAAGTPVFGGGGDASLIGVGAGSVLSGETHIYAGTSGWVSTVVDKPLLDINAMIASIVGAQPGKFNYFAELETAGKCLEWVKDHLALDEIGVYLDGELVHQSKETVFTSLYDYLSKVTEKVQPGSGGVIFTPWLHGNRCPFEDSAARGMFFNIGLETGKSELIRSVVEGVCFHLRWMLESQEKKIKTSETIRFVGGGALSAVTCQILADVLQREVETVENPQNVGAVGSAIVAAIGLGLIDSFSAAKQLVPAAGTYSPNPEHKRIYDRHYQVFKNLYRDNRKSYHFLNTCKQQ